MGENYKRLYEQTKKMVEKYQDVIVPGFRKLVSDLESKRVEVVRCKDCKWTGGKESVFCPGHLACNKWSKILYVKPNDFCSYGERRNNG